MAQKYFRFTDCETGTSLETGYNSTSEKQLANAFKSYKINDLDPQDRHRLKKANVRETINMAMCLGFYFETSAEPFND